MDAFSKMTGPGFLAFYFAWFVIIFLGVVVLRRLGLGSPSVTLGGLLLFEGLGIFRIIEGSTRGLHRWEFLLIGMLVGGVFFLLRVTNSGGGGSAGGCSATTGGGCGGAGFIGGGSSSCSSGSSSCSGGSSCGGGGCGGCGGS